MKLKPTCLTDIILLTNKDVTVDQFRLLVDWVATTNKYKVPMSEHDHKLCVDKIYSNYQNGMYNIGGRGTDDIKTKTKRK